MNNKQKVNLALASFLILFLELALIRWIATEIRIFAYFQNLVLLACFIGGGIGCYLSARKIRLYIPLYMLSLLAGLVILPIYVHFDGQALHLFRNIPVFLASFADSVILYQRTIGHLYFMQAIGFLATLVIFSCIVLAFIPLGQILGRVFEESKNPIEAYSMNVAASLLGIWAFSAFSFFYTSPWVWWLVSLVIIIVLMIFAPTEATSGEKKKKFFLNENFLKVSGLFAGFLAVGLLVANSSTIHSYKMKHGMTIWSPYQKLTLAPYPNLEGTDPFKTINFTGYNMKVNNVGFMDLINLSDSFIKLAKDVMKHPVYQNQVIGKLNRFNLAFYLKPNTKSALILGGGAGNDAAAAVRAGLNQIDVVEIDPGIYDLGVQYHPEQPYAHPNVRVFVDDARAFVKKTKNKYDLVYFGLLDAHSQSSSMHSMRMDNYVYTQESFEEAKHLLKEDGIFVVTYWVQRFWVAKRIENVLKKVFGWDPFVISIGAQNGLGPIMMITGPSRQHVVDLLKNNDPAVRNYIIANVINYKEENKIITDDWPYLYLRDRTIPGMYLMMIAAIAALFLMGRRFFFKKGQRLDFHFFFLGAAFLLLEFQNINKTALLFGVTWIVNSINISMILFLILLANLCVQRFKIQDVRFAYVFLFLSLLVNFLIPLNAYNVFGYWTKSLLASTMLNLPIFFAGIIFAVSFTRTQNRSLAFGSNLIGAVAGGLLETVSFITGIKLLILLTMALYGLSMAFKK